MDNHTLLQCVEVRRVMNATAAGTTSVNGTGVDVQGYDGVAFVAAFGTLTATQTTSLKLQQSSDDGSTDTYDDILGSSTGNMADGDSNKVLMSEIYKPLKRYVRPVVVRGTANAVIDGVFAMLYRAEKSPTPQHSTVSKAAKFLRSPAEGTA